LSSYIFFNVTWDDVQRRGRRRKNDKIVRVTRINSTINFVRSFQLNFNKGMSMVEIRMINAVNIVTIKDKERTITTL
jgi:hypothetical protein